VGRSLQLEQLLELLERRIPLLTLLGAPGIGKTRLALRVAERLVDQLPGGVWFVDLSEARTTGDLTAAVARALEIPDSAAGTSEPAALGHLLAEKGRTLIVLDNFEQLSDGASDVVSRWLELAPQLQGLVTSRSRLGVSAETSRQVGPLSPEEAMELFELDAASQESVEFSEADRQVVLEIVERLDCIPLAIKLAAARVPTLSLGELRNRLQDRFKLLSSRSRDTPARHASLIEAIGWSWAQLPTYAADALAQVTVFRGGFTLASAEAVIDLGHDTSQTVADVLQLLVDRSLLLVRHPGGLSAPSRFTIFSTVREYAAGHLLPEMRSACALRHSQYFVAFAQAQASAYLGEGGEQALEALEAEVDNVIEVHRRERKAAPAVACEAVLTLLHVVRVRRLYSSYASLFDRAIDCALESQQDSLEARARWTRAAVVLNGGTPARAAHDLERTAALAAGLGDQALEANALIGLGALKFRNPACWRGAQNDWERAADLYLENEDKVGAANAMANLAVLALDADQIAAAESHCVESLRLLDEVGAVHRRSFPLMVWAAIAQESGNLRLARARYNDAIEIAREVHKHRGHEAESLTHLGILECDAGDWTAAEASLSTAVQLYDAIGAPPECCIASAFLAVAVAHLDHSGKARAMWEKCDTPLRSLGLRDSAQLAQILNAMVDELDATTHATAPAPEDGIDDDASHLVRVAQRLWGRTRAGMVGSANLRIGPDGRWFALGEAPEVDLKRRMLLRRLLCRLAQHWQEARGKPLPVPTLIDSCWPGENVGTASASNRLYVAMSKLRRLGLADVLVTDPDGYLIDPRYSVSLEE